MADTLSELQDRLQYRFGDPSLLERAMTHASARGEDQAANERLEFLGDAVVGFVISEHLFRSLREAPEGRMTRIKSAVVSRQTLARIGRSLGLREWLRVDAGLRQWEQYPGSMVAGAYEAVVGAIFLDGGIDAAREFVLRTLAEEVEHALVERHHEDYKSALQWKSLAEGKGIPQYEVVRQEGPDHRRRFLTTVYIGGKECGSGWGRTKKSAEQSAAAQALGEPFVEPEDQPGERGSGS